MSTTSCIRVHVVRVYGLAPSDEEEGRGVQESPEPETSPGTRDVQTQAGLFVSSVVHSTDEGGRGPDGPHVDETFR